LPRIRRSIRCGRSPRGHIAWPNRLHAVDNQIQDHVLQLNGVTLDWQHLRDTNQKTDFEES
jgi:hypothetical protein